jgi:hypothetical protein
MDNFVFYSSRNERQTALFQEDDDIFVITLSVVAGFLTVDCCNDAFWAVILMYKKLIFLLSSFSSVKVRLSRKISYCVYDVGNSLFENKSLTIIFNSKTLLNI